MMATPCPVYCIHTITRLISPVAVDMDEWSWCIAMKWETSTSMLSSARSCFRRLIRCWVRIFSLARCCISCSISFSFLFWPCRAKHSSINYKFIAHFFWFFMNIILIFNTNISVYPRSRLGLTLQPPCFTCMYLRAHFRIFRLDIFLSSRLGTCRFKFSKHSFRWARLSKETTNIMPKGHSV